MNVDLMTVTVRTHGVRWAWPGGTPRPAHFAISEFTLAGRGQISD